MGENNPLKTCAPTKLFIHFFRHKRLPSLVIEEDPDFRYLALWLVNYFHNRFLDVGSLLRIDLRGSSAFPKG